MQFMDDSLLPENQDPLVIQVAPYAPSFLPRDSDDIPVSMQDQVQKAVDCYNAGATVLHVHVREPDGKGSKRLDMFNEMLDRLRTAVPKMILQVGGSNLLNYLVARAAIPEYQVRWRWRPNSVAIWDNRATQHYAVMDYWPAVRKMERAGIVGDKPY